MEVWLTGTRHFVIDDPLRHFELDLSEQWGAEVGYEIAVADEATLERLPN